MEAETPSTEEPPVQEPDEPMTPPSQQQDVSTGARSAGKGLWLVQYLILEPFQKALVRGEQGESNSLLNL